MKFLFKKNWNEFTLKAAIEQLNTTRLIDRRESNHWTKPLKTMREETPETTLNHPEPNDYNCLSFILYGPYRASFLLFYQAFLS